MGSMRWCWSGLRPLVDDGDVDGVAGEDAVASGGRLGEDGADVGGDGGGGGGGCG